MILTDELKVLIFKKKLTQEKVAEMIGITPKTFYLKMKKGVFGSDEIQKIIDVLEIDNPAAIFFAEGVTPQVTGAREEAQ